MIKRRIVKEEILADDFTGEEIPEGGGGWEVRGIGDAEAVWHFTTLSNLYLAMQDATKLGFSQPDYFTRQVK